MFTKRPTGNAQIPHGPEHLDCPYHKKAMSKVCHRCPMWVKVAGKNPQSTEMIERWDCSLAWIPILLIENTQMTRGTGTAVESLRNEIVARSTAPVTRPELLRSPTGDEFQERFVSPKNNKMIGGK